MDMFQVCFSPGREKMYPSWGYVCPAQIPGIMGTMEAVPALWAAPCLTADTGTTPWMQCQTLTPVFCNVQWTNVAALAPPPQGDNAASDGAQSKDNVAPVSAGQPIGPVSVEDFISSCAESSDFLSQMAGLVDRQVAAYWKKRAERDAERSRKHKRRSNTWTRREHEPLLPAPEPGGCVEFHPDEVKQALCSLESRLAEIAKTWKGKLLLTNIIGHHSDATICSAMARIITPNMLSVAKDKSGCRVIQALIPAIDQKALVGVTASFRGHVMACSLCPNANHVIQALVKEAPADLTRFVRREVERVAYQLAITQYGCRIVQRILEKSGATDTGNLVKALIAHADALIIDQYGNYVVQHILTFAKLVYANVLLERIANMPDLMAIATHKAASCVIDTAIQVEQNMMRTGLSEGRLACALVDHIDMECLSMAKFGHYVAKDLITHSCDRVRTRATGAVEAARSQLENHYYGRHVVRHMDMHK